MRKYILGIAIGIVFLAYSLVLRHQHSEPVIVADLPSKNSTVSSPQSSGTAGTNSSSSTSSTVAPAPQYKDGTYTGSIANAYYGNVQVSATVSNGKITEVNFLESPDENPNSIYVNEQAKPVLSHEAISTQKAKVSIVTGATFTSQAFIQSLSNALSQAK